MWKELVFLTSEDGEFHDGIDFIRRRDPHVGLVDDYSGAIVSHAYARQTA